jgi:hypothetical protein
MIDLNNYLTDDLSYLSDFEGLKRRALKHDNSLDQIASAIYKAILTCSFTQNQKDNLAPFCRTLFNNLNKESKKLWMNNFFELWEDTEDKDTLLSILYHTDKGDEIFNKLSSIERVLYSTPWIRPMIKLSNTELFPRFALKQLWDATPKKAHKTLFDKIISELHSFGFDHSVSLSELLKDPDFIRLFKSETN